MSDFATIPMQTVGPVKIIGPVLNDIVHVPLATFESPLWPSVKRGARVTELAGGIYTTVVKECMTRSFVFEAPNANEAASVANHLLARENDIRQVIQKTSRFAQYKSHHTQIVANLLYVRLEISTADASGHNMVTKAADELMVWMLQQFPQLQYVSVSANFCTDKKASAVNGILGRGKYVIAETTIPAKLCRRYLRTTAQKIVDLNIKKNLLGTLIAGGIRSANAHFANMLLAFYLATGQDAANIVEGSQGIVHTEVRGEDLYFSATLPNIIVGSIGNGKELEFVQENLKKIGCLEKREPGENSRRLAAITAAVVLCGELSLLAALTNNGELMQSHLRLERNSDVLV